jgi:hypothetical protein
MLYKAGALTGILDELPPKGIPLKGISTAEDEERGLGAGQGHVQASGIGKEADAASVRGSHTRKDDNLFLLSLIAILNEDKIDDQM